MPLQLYRRHSQECLAEIEARIAAGKMKRPESLDQYKGCSCVWWARGVSDYGVKIGRKTTKARRWEAACAALKRFNQPPKEEAAAPERMLLADALRLWLKDKVKPNSCEITHELYQRPAEELIAKRANARLMMQ